jgi:SAM-dependent methyltransferase
VALVTGTGRASGRRFDRDHGVTTQALFLLSQLGETRAEAYRHATHYEPVPVDAFRALLARVPTRFVRTSTFVDVGSGMGRGVLLASEYPFEQVAGIELSPALHAIAAANVAAAHHLATQCRDARLRCGDARRARYPKGNLVVFLFNPFDGEVVRAVLERILASRSERDEVVLLYHAPVHRDVVAEYAGDLLADTADGIVVALKRSREGRDPSASRCSAESRAPRNR